MHRLRQIQNSETTRVRAKLTFWSRLGLWSQHFGNEASRGADSRLCTFARRGVAKVFHFGTKFTPSVTVTALYPKVRPKENRENVQVRSPNCMARGSKESEVERPALQLTLLQLTLLLVDNVYPRRFCHRSRCMRFCQCLPLHGVQHRTNPVLRQYAERSFWFFVTCHVIDWNGYLQPASPQVASLLGLLGIPLGDVTGQVGGK